MAQDRLKSLPTYQHYETVKKAAREAVKRGATAVTWKDGGAMIEYVKDDRQWRYDVALRQAEDVGPALAKAEHSSVQAADRTRARRETWERPDRGRQFPVSVSPDGTMTAWHRARNLYLGGGAHGGETAVTTDATDANRLRYGTANWTYGEELRQKTALWWSPNGRRLAFYRFDEKSVPDYFLTLDHTKRHPTLDIEPYTKTGEANPQVDLLIYDLDTRQTLTVDARDGKPFDDDVMGHYLFGVMWSPDGQELLFHRMDRRQKAMELCAADPATGQCRVILREEWLASWVDPDLATLHFLKDGRRFIHASERTGWANYYLYDLAGQLLATLTEHAFETAGIVRVDEAAGCLYYLARSGDNHMKRQLHRVALDGAGDRRLTDPAFDHRVDIAPDGRHFLDTRQTHDQPASLHLLTTEGEPVADLAASDLTKWNELGLKHAELFTFPAADGETELHGLLHFPTSFDPAQQWPLLLSVYAGPATNGASETFVTPSTLTELGFLVATVDARSAAGRGKKFLDAIYQKLGRVEIDDLAAGVKALRERPYVDGTRVGAFGTSYGGTASALCLLRHPDIFQAACASSAVMDFRNYDTIYTERYLGLPSENKEGYDAASPMTYAKDLRGRLMIFYGTADNNVHPSNSLQLIAALQREGKSFDVQVGPDQGHVSLNRERMMEFFHDALGSGPLPPSPPAPANADTTARPTGIN